MHVSVSLEKDWDGLGQGMALELRARLRRIRGVCGCLCKTLPHAIAGTGRMHACACCKQGMEGVLWLEHMGAEWQQKSSRLSCWKTRHVEVACWAHLLHWDVCGRAAAGAARPRLPLLFCIDIVQACDALWRCMVAHAGFPAPTQHILHVQEQCICCSSLDGLFSFESGLHAACLCRAQPLAWVMRPSTAGRALLRSTSVLCSTT